MREALFACYPGVFGRRLAIVLAVAWFIPCQAEGSVRDFSATVYFINFGAPSSQTLHFRIYTPPAADVPRLRGVVFMMGGSGHDWRYRVNDPVWQEASRALGFAFLSVNMSVGLGTPESLESILQAAAVATGRAELVNVPVVATGFSLGAIEAANFVNNVPERTLAAVANCAAANLGGTNPAAARRVHTLLIPGELDTAAGQGVNTFPTYRSSTQSANAAFAVNWRVGHSTFANQEWSMAWTWIAGAAATRLPSGVAPSLDTGNPLPLVEVPVSSGWLGQRVYAQSSNGSDRSAFSPIAPASSYAATPSASASWLPNEAVARVYRAFSSYDGITGRPIPRQGPLVITGAAAPSAVVVAGQGIAPQMAVLPMGTNLDISVDPRGFGQGSNPDSSKDPIKSMEYYEDSDFLGVQTAPGPGGWSLPHTLAMPGVRSLTVVAEDWNGNRSSAFRTVVVSRPVADDRVYYRFERSPGFTVDHYGRLRLSAAGSSGSLPTQVSLSSSGPGSAFPRKIVTEEFENDHSVRFVAANNDRLSRSDSDLLPSGSTPFTVEAFINLTSHATGGGFRTIATHGEGDSLGWRLLVAGEGSGSSSRRVVIRCRADDKGGEPGGTLLTIDSGLEILPGEDYYLGVMVDPGDTTVGGVRFYLRNLTRKEPLQISERSHNLGLLYNSPLTFHIGFGWDGLLDEFRLTKRRLEVGELLISQTVPVVPQGLVVGPGAQAGEIQTAWEAAAFANAYRVERGTSSDGAFDFVAEVSGTTFTDVGLSPGQTYYYRVISANGDIVSESSGTVSAQPHIPANYAGWRYVHFRTNDPTNPSGAYSSDPDGDGLSNLLEYASGRNPLVPDGWGAIELSRLPNDGRIRITFNRIADPELVYRVEASSDIASSMWSSVFVSSGVSNEEGPVTVVDSEESGETSMRFFRLRVTYDAPP